MENTQPPTAKPERERFDRAKLSCLITASDRGFNIILEGLWNPRLINMATRAFVRQMQVDNSEKRRVLRVAQKEAAANPVIPDTPEVPDTKDGVCEKCSNNGVYLLSVNQGDLSYEDTIFCECPKGVEMKALDAQAQGSEAQDEIEPVKVDGDDTPEVPDTEPDPETEPAEEPLEEAETETEEAE